MYRFLGEVNFILPSAGIATSQMLNTHKNYLKQKIRISNRATMYAVITMWQQIFFVHIRRCNTLRWFVISNF